MPRVSSVGVLLHTCSLSSPRPPQPEPTCQWGSGTLLTAMWIAFVTGPLTIKEINDVGGGKLKSYESLSGTKHEKNSYFLFCCLFVFFVCVCVRARDCSNPKLGLGSTQTKGKFYVDKCLPLVVDEENKASQLKWTLKTHNKQHEHAGRHSRKLHTLCVNICHSNKLFLFV